MPCAYNYTSMSYLGMSEDSVSSYHRKHVGPSIRPGGTLPNMNYLINSLTTYHFQSHENIVYGSWAICCVTMLLRKMCRQVHEHQFGCRLACVGV